MELKVWLRWLVLIYPIYALAQLPRQQIPFGLKNEISSEAEGESNGETAATKGSTNQINEESYLLHPLTSLTSQSSSDPTPSDHFHLAKSLLKSVTERALPPPPTSYTSSSTKSSKSSSSWIFYQLETHIGGRLGGKWIRSFRKGVNYLYGGSSSLESNPGKEYDWSVRATVRKVAQKIRIKTSSSPLPSTTSVGSGSTGGRVKKWREQLLNLGENARGAHKGRVEPLVPLSKEEVAEGMEEVLQLTKKAAEGGSAQAWVLLGNLHLSGHLTIPPDAHSALEAYARASEGWGIPEAQYKLGFLYGSNYGSEMGAYEQIGKQGSALLHYTFAALSGHVPASMTVGYRHWVGIGTKQSCKDALGWYKAAADQAMRAFNSGPPGGRHLPPHKVRLSDLKGGAYGSGASSSHRSGGLNSQTEQEWNDLVEFHHFHADTRQDPKYMFLLGRLYYQGFGGNGKGGSRNGSPRLDVAAVPFTDGLWEGGRNYGLARNWFFKVARSVWPQDPKEATTNPKDPRGMLKKGEAPRIGFYDASKDRKNPKAGENLSMLGGLAAGYLGRMYLRGEGARTDYAKAFLWFMRGSGQGDRESNNGLGIMFRDGLGVERDVKKANSLFVAAAQQDLAEAQVNLGKFNFGMGEFAHAKTYFEHAVRPDGNRVPDTFESYYYLAELYAHSGHLDDQCPGAVSFYKLVAERGDWDHEVWWEAEQALKRDDQRTALLGYWIMAERGYEAAQNNVAWILDRDKKRLRIPLLDGEPASNETDRVALTYWTRSAAQDNVDALVKMGDYYYAGLGTDSEPQLEKAAACYTSASTSRLSAMAMWNLGWMHENGKGVAKDYHLAKRYYDLALDTSYDAYLPATLSLISLHARSLHNTFFGKDDDLKSLSLFGKAKTPPEDSTKPKGETASSTQKWSLGRAWREMKRRWGIDVPPEGTDLDAANAIDRSGANPESEAASHSDRTNDERAVLENNEEWGNGGRREVDDDDQEEFMLAGDSDLGGTVTIVALCMLLAWLLYFRQGRLPAEGGRQRLHQGINNEARPVHDVAPVPDINIPGAAAYNPAAPDPIPTPPPISPEESEADGDGDD